MSASKEIRLSSLPHAFTANGKKTIGDIYGTDATGIANAKRDFPDAFRAMATMRQWTDTQTMARSMFNMLRDQALWQGAQHQNITNAAGVKVGDRLISRNTIVNDLYGAWWINDYAHYAYGTDHFPNAGPGNAEYGGDLGGFELMHWHEKWVGPSTNRSNGDRVLFGALHGGSDVLVDYSEGTFITGALRIDGRAGDYLNTTRPRIVGAEWWDMGEASNVPAIFAHHCDIGQRYARGTPANAPFTQSCFSNTVAGTEVNGAANIHIALLSGDDSPAFLRSVPGYGRPATMNARIDCIKAEWAVTPNTMRLWKPQHIMELEGQFKVSVGLLTYAATNARTESMFRVNPTLSDSYLKVEVIDVFNKQAPDYFVHDLKNGKAWPFNANVTGFEYYSYGGGTLKTWPVQVDPVALPAAPRKGYVVSGSAFPSWSDATGNGGTVTPPTPVPIPPTPTPIPPTTPVLAFATTFTGSGPNLQPTKGTAIAPTSGSTATFSNGTITTNTGTKYPWSAGRAQRIVLLGVTLKAAPNWQYITANHVVYAGTGRIYYRADPNTSSGDIDTGLTLTQGVKVTSLSLPCPSGILTTVLGSPVGAGNGAPMTVEALEVYQ